MSVPQIEMVLAIIILSVLVILMAIQCTEECGLGAHELPSFGINSTTARHPIQLELNVPKVIDCYVDCNDNRSLSGCNISHDWVLRFPYRHENRSVVERISTVRSSIRNTTIEGLNINFDPVTFQSDICPNGRSFYPFSIILTMHQYSQELKQISVICGIGRPNTSSIHDINNIVILESNGDESLPDVFSKDIDCNPNKEVQERGNISFTCTRTANNLSVSSPVWQLTNSSMQSINLNMNKSHTISLNNNTDLVVNLEDAYGAPYNDPRSAESKPVQDFRLTLLNLSVDITGMTVQCGVQTQEGDTHFYNRSATVTVLAPVNIIFSNDADRRPLLKLKMNDAKHIYNITCTKRKGYMSDVRVKLLADSGTISDSQEWTFAMDKHILNDYGVDVKESSLSETNWLTFHIVLKDIKTSMTVECGAKDANGNHSQFYKHVTVVVDISDAPPSDTCALSNSESIGSISSLTVFLLIAIVTETVVVIVAIKLYSLRRRRDDDARHQHVNELNEVHINYREEQEINGEIEEFNQGMIGQDEPPIAR